LAQSKRKWQETPKVRRACERKTTAGGDSQSDLEAYQQRVLQIIVHV
jgi:hypothetical protein